VQLSADMMVAALFVAGLYLTAQDVADDRELWGFVAQVVARDGTEFLEEAVTRLPVLERDGRLPAAMGASGQTGWLSAAAASPR
jgi:hypothetical protein